MNTPAINKSIGDVAIIGMAGRFPGARNIDAFWQNLTNGVESIRRFTDAELLAAGVSAELLANPAYVRARPVLEDAEKFDAEFFGIGLREAEVMDPQQRVFLETCYEALEHAGYNSENYPGAIGLWGGLYFDTYLLANLCTSHERTESVLTYNRPGAYLTYLGNDKDNMTTRVAYKLNLRGPAITVLTSCSTSLVAVAQACQSLLYYQCDMALAGGVAIICPQTRGYISQEGGMLTPDGHCRAFDVRAQGTLFGNGCGLVVLKRLDDALADGDQVHAVIKGAAINNDGAVKVSYTAPSIEGQAEVIALAQALAGVDADSISYVEAHGTGTPLGDPIEVAALTQAFRQSTDRKGFCGIGSLKTNVGHLDVAAGVAGVIKTTLALQHNLIPPTLHFTAPNPKIDFANSPFYVVAKPTEWNPGPAPRRAGVSSFGVGGTNAHVILEEAPAVEPSGPSRPVQLLTLSAKTPAALDAATANLAEHLKDPVNLADAAFTLHVGRRSFQHRRIIVVRDAAQVTDPKRTFSQSTPLADMPVAFLFPGQGAQQVGMGRELYELEPVFRETFDRCAQILGMDLKALIFSGTAEQLNQTRFTQPALFVIEYALAQLWMSWGFRPEAMIGHSVGEYVAACLAGVLTLEDALKLVAARAQMVWDLPRGSMLAARLPEIELLPLLGDNISIAAINAPGMCVASGPTDAIETLQAKLQERKVPAKVLATSHAFHSPMMDSLAGSFTELVRKTKLSEPQIPYVSNVTGCWITAAQATDPAYWFQHLRQAVRFADSVAELVKDPRRILLEVGPGQTLAQLSRQHPARSKDQLVIASLCQPSDLESVLTALGRLWMAGAKVDWDGFHAGEKRHRIPLPTYPFERKRYWVEPDQKPSPITLPTKRSEFTSEVKVIEATLPQPQVETTKRTGRVDSVLSALKAELRELSGMDPASIDSKATFMEMGFDSLFLTQAAVAFQNKCGVKISFRQLLEDLSTLDALARFIDEQLPAEAPVAAPAPVPVPVLPDLEVLTQQLQAMQRQIDALRQAPAAPPAGGVMPAPAQRRDESIRIPVTPAQEGIWITCQMSGEASCAFNLSSSLTMRGALDVEALRRAAQAVVDRHDALRATFATDGTEQIILPKLKLEIPLVDFSKLPARVHDEKIAELVDREGRVAFDLARGPLLRAKIIKLEEQVHLFLMTVHHIVCDGQSMATVFGDLSALYTAFSQKSEPSLKWPMQYSEFSRWQAEQQKSPAWAEVERFWLRQFADPIPALDLPGDRSRPAVRTFNGGEERVIFDAALCAALKQFCAKQNCTLFATLLGAFDILLHRLSGVSDIAVGVPAAGQVLVNSNDLVGHCMTMLPLRQRLNQDQRVGEFLASVKTTVLDAFDRQNYSFSALVKKLNVPRDASRMPLIATLFNVDRENAKPSYGDLAVERKTYTRQFSEFDLFFNLLQVGAEMQIDCTYNSDLFDHATIRRWIGHYRTILEGIVADPARRIAELPLLSAAEQRQLLEDWNATQMSYPQDAGLHQLVEAQVAKTPDAIAAVFEGQSLTYRELNAQADRLAQHLHGLGVKPGALAGIYVERSLDMLVGLLGILKAGGAYLPLDPSFPADRLAFMLEDSQPVALLTQKKLLGALPPHQSQVVCLDAMPANVQTDARIPSPQSTDLAYVLYTSGSTGKPKGVQIPHRAVVNFLTSMRREPGLASSDVLVAVTTLSFDIAGLELYLPLVTGASVVIASRETAADGVALAQLLDQSGATVMQATPATWRVLLASGWPGDPRLKVLCGGEAMPADLANDLRPRCAALWNMYGPTETTIWSAVGRVEVGQPIRLGRPIGNTTFYVVDSQLRPVPVGLPGELLIGGDGLACGYLNRPELTAEKFVANPFQSGTRLYRTGDLVRRCADGAVEFLGRLDHQVKIRGYRIELGEIETTLSRHPSVREAVVVAREDVPGDQRLVAYLVQSNGVRPEPGELRQLLAATLPEYMVPSAYVVLEKFPLTPNGKVNRKALPPPDQSHVEKASGFVAPRTPVEERLAGIWREVLRVPAVGVHDNFFAVGGHSLLAVQVVTRVRDVLAVPLPLASLFERPTVGGMAEQIQAMQSVNPHGESAGPVIEGEL